MVTIQHPAKFSTSVLEAALKVLDEREFSGTILDPFAGTGRVHELGSLVMKPDGTYVLRNTYGVELEPEWAALSPYTAVGDATKLPVHWTGIWDCVFTSPPYANRMADKYAGDTKNSRRHTYRIALGRPLSKGSAAAMQWGDDYRETMLAALHEMDRVLRVGGLVLLNLSNHIRKGVVVGVCDWYLEMLQDFAWEMEEAVPVNTPRNRHGENAELRAANEWLFVFKKYA